MHLKLLFTFPVIFFFFLLPSNFTLTIHFLFYFFFYCLQIKYLLRQVQTKSMWTRHSIFRLIFSTCDKINTFVNNYIHIFVKYHYIYFYINIYCIFYNKNMYMFVFPFILLQRASQDKFNGWTKKNGSDLLVNFVWCWRNEFSNMFCLVL